VATKRPHPKFRTVSVYVTEPIHEGASRIAARELVSLSAIVRRALRAEIERQDRDKAARDDA
jgi:hypothetical protein